jgi:hypothetical protein
MPHAIDDHPAPRPLKQVDKLLAEQSAEFLKSTIPMSLMSTPMPIAAQQKAFRSGAMAQQLAGAII